MRLRILLIALITSGCAGSPASPTSQAENFTWTVNGQAFTATSNGRAALRAGAALSVTGFNCGSGAGLGINVPNVALGTYGVGPGAAAITWTPDGRTGNAANESWNAPGIPRVVGNAIVSGGSGSVTISLISSSWVSGSFSAEVVANPSNRDTGPKTVQGSFELPLLDRRVC